MQLVHTQPKEITAGDIFANPVDFINDKMKGFALDSEIANERFITRVQALSTVYQQQHHIGFLDGRHGLICHRGIDALFLTRNTAGVDDNEGGLVDPSLTILPVAGQTRQVCYQGIATAGQLIKEGGFADVGAAHQGEHRQHDVSSAPRRRRLSACRHWHR